jgi:hypothetical protein
MGWVRNGVVVTLEPITLAQPWRRGSSGRSARPVVLRSNPASPPFGEERPVAPNVGPSRALPATGARVLLWWARLIGIRLQSNAFADSPDWLKSVLTERLSRSPSIRNSYFFLVGS